jgi:hypothetical protein
LHFSAILLSRKFVMFIVTLMIENCFWTWSIFWKLGNYGEHNCRSTSWNQWVSERPASLTLFHFVVNNAKTTKLSLLR